MPRLVASSRYHHVQGCKLIVSLIASSNEDVARFAYIHVLLPAIMLIEQDTCAVEIMQVILGPVFSIREGDLLLI